MTQALLNRAFELFDAANSQDPTLIECEGGQTRARELVHAEHLTAWVRRVAPDAPEALLLASRCQHLRRWEIPRSSFAEGRAGYLKWRLQLAKFHADEAGKILESLGYAAAILDEVRRINLKQDLKRNPNAQAMEDALCLAFLEHELAAFSEKHAADDVVRILRKTWGKMSERGQALAQSLAFPPRLQALLERALAPDVAEVSS